MPRVAKPKTATTTTAALAKAEDAVPDAMADVPRETKPEVPAPKPERPCAIEGAPLNSKATVGTTPDGLKEARITTPKDGTVSLPKDDLMWTLPVGARIRKVSNVQFIGAQMQDPYGHPPLVGVSARDVIQGFNDHFHPRGQ